MITSAQMLWLFWRQDLIFAQTTILCYVWMTGCVMTPSFFLLRWDLPNVLPGTTIPLISASHIAWDDR
jgi:hypothetical protein